VLQRTAGQRPCACWTNRRIQTEIKARGYSVTYFPNEFYQAFDARYLPVTGECKSQRAQSAGGDVKRLRKGIDWDVFETNSVMQIQMVDDAARSKTTSTPFAT
jgi:hypothetical protein